MRTGVSRRMVLASAAGVAASVIAARTRGATPPKESGLSSEGLLVGHPGFQPRTHAELPGFLSRAQLAAHHDEYVRDVERLRETEDALRADHIDWEEVARRYEAVDRM